MTDPTATRRTVTVDGVTRTFDYVPRLDERNNRYLVRSIATEAPQWSERIWWTGGPVLDQGSEGACCGFAAAGEAQASPERVQVSSPGLSTVEAGNRWALSLYNRAKELDEWEGVDYDGTSVRAALLAERELGLIERFYWAKNMDEFLQALHLGPVDIGCVWKAGMYATDENGLVTVSGDEVGWHSILITGYSPNYGGHGRRFRWRNSWSLDYGKNGNGYIEPDAVEDICFGAGGEAGVVLGRKLARITA